MVTTWSSGMPLSSASSSVMILVVLAGYMRTRLFLLSRISPVSMSNRNADSA